MAYKIDDKKIGEYLGKLIDEKYGTEYGAKNIFYEEWIKAEYEDTKIDESEIQKKRNRLSSIKRGTRSIQIDDLPIFSELLGVTCEEILSAGTFKGEEYQAEKKNSHLTNFSVAQSANKYIWRKYIKDERQPILHADEYGKTVLEYAIDFKNYDFIKFLFDEKYIWLDSGKGWDGLMRLSIGTDIKKNNRLTDDLQHKLISEAQMRMDIIALAIDKGDIAMLDELRARETLEIYYRKCYSLTEIKCADFECNKDIVEHIVKQDNEAVVKYFTEPFEIRNGPKYKDGSEQKDIFIFPYYSEMLDLMIANNNPYLKDALERAVAHNESTQRMLVNLTNKTKNEYCYLGAKNMMHSSGDFIYFFASAANRRFITNIVHVTKRYEGDLEIIELIKRLQKSYRNIMNMPMMERK